MFEFCVFHFAALRCLFTIYLMYEPTNVQKTTTEKNDDLWQKHLFGTFSFLFVFFLNIHLPKEIVTQGVREKDSEKESK